LTELILRIFKWKHIGMASIKKKKVNIVYGNTKGGRTYSNHRSALSSQYRLGK